MSSSSQDVAALAGLITATRDTMRSYGDAREETAGARHEASLSMFANHLRNIVASLEEEVRKLGGEVGTHTGPPAQVPAMDLKGVAAAHDDHALLQEVARGEQQLQSKFEEALADTSLAPGTLAAIREAHASIKADLESTKALDHTPAAHITPPGVV